jgi:hypothetical protein
MHNTISLAIRNLITPSSQIEDRSLESRKRTMYKTGRYNMAAALAELQDLLVAGP